MKISINDCAVVDLFCGVGGLTHGFLLEKFKVVAGIDIDKDCEYAYTYNNKTKFLQSDISQMDSEVIKNLFPTQNIKILVGCAPCQPFSSMTLYKRKKNQKEDNKWFLLNHFAKFIEEIQPEIVSMENVPQIKNQEVYNNFLNILNKNNYYIFAKVIQCADYGIPQKRRRLVLLASKLGNITLMEATHKENYVTVKQAISDLPEIKDGEICDTDKLHRSSKLSELNKKRISATPEGGGWHDWPEELILNCHKKSSGKSYKDVYGRISWNSPSPTITTKFRGYGSGRFGHPEQNRALSLREGALLQTFPKEYQFIPSNIPFSINVVAKLIGNAVPVTLGKVIAKSIFNHINEFSK